MIKALADEEIEKGPDELDAKLDALVATANLGGIKINLNNDTRKYADPADAHTLYATATEFTSFVGHGNLELLEFLG